MKRSIILATLLLLAAAPASPAAETEGTSADGVPYALRVPDGYDPAKGGLLIVDLHDKLHIETKFIYQLDTASYLAGAILLAPYGKRTDKGESWNDGEILALVREVRAKHKTRRTVVFCHGGAGFVGLILGLQHPGDVQGVVICSSFLVDVDFLPTSSMKTLLIYAIERATDSNAAKTREVMNKLQSSGFTVRYEEVAGTGAGSVDEQATARAFDWIDSKLGSLKPPRPKLTEAEAKEHMASLERYAKAKDYAAAAETLTALETAPASLAKKVAALAKTHARAPDDRLALAAVGLAVTLKGEGLPALKVALKAKSKAVADGAAAGLARVGGDEAVTVLIDGLKSAESSKARAEVAQAIQAALTRATGKSFPNAKEWKRWQKG